ncbi:heavy metal translocating P-type ATPase [Microbacterium sulfonylureivorans]|uniref:heavy metal translocating P-type ATPase n=1 Tax=Microbacterium sulfonylureivorans TaxID=2486854 RepID=UPI000FD71C8F|nr:heavy metal translocating P-type ATPase [Microbacterium sulfonylureivorans]
MTKKTSSRSAGPRADTADAPPPTNPASDASSGAGFRNGLRRVLGPIRRFPWVTATVGVAMLGGALALTAGPATGELVVTAYVVLMAARSAWAMLQMLRTGTFGVDIIAVTAIIAAVLVGETWAALVIVLMLTTGQALESYAAHRARRDLTDLLARNPQIAHRVLADGTIEDATVGDIVPTDRVLVRANEVVPVDGILIDRTAVFDESSLTGESLPVDKVAGDDVLSGSVNGSASVILEATRAAKDSQYQQIVALVESAASSKAPIVRLADRFALPFALTAYAIAGLAWWLSGDPARFAEVLVVATPCPLIIAAPVAFMAGMSRAARDGVIIRSSSTLEKLHRVRAFAFDKTGTLTRGEPTLVDIRTERGVSPATLLQFAASVESNSTHTLARAILRGADERGIAVTDSDDAEEATGNGVIAHVSGCVVAVGKRDFIARHTGRSIPRTELARGEMATYVAIGADFAGVLVFRDEVRANAAATVAALRARGIDAVTMLTGDDRATADHIAAEVGIDDVRANCLPIDKVDFITHAPLRPIAMVGDGINDAPVLAAADIGIAMGARGATAASEAADIVVLPDDVGRIADAVTIGRRTVDIALQAIWIGIGLSLVLMLLAAFGLVPAIVGAWLQEAIDVVAILWALRATRTRVS